MIVETYLDGSDLAASAQRPRHLIQCRAANRGMEIFKIGQRRSQLLSQFSVET